jgi:hypothetical protein
MLSLLKKKKKKKRGRRRHEHGVENKRNILLVITILPQIEINNFLLLWTP